MCAMYIQGLTDREAMGIPDSSTGPIPSYFTHRFSFLLPSLVQVADQLGCIVPFRTGPGPRPELAGPRADAGSDFSGLISLAGQVGYQLFAAKRYRRFTVRARKRGQRSQLRRTEDQ